MKFLELKSTLQNAKLDPHYFFHSPDPYLLDQTRQLLIRRIQDDLKEEIHLIKVDLEETPVDSILNVARNLTLFARRQMIQVKGFMKLRENQGKKLEEYLRNPCEPTVLLFLAGDLTREDREKKIFKILESRTRMIEISALDENEVRRWIGSRFKLSGFSIEADAVTFLQESQGNNLERLSHEIEKLTLYAAGEKRITFPMVEVTAGFPRHHNIYEFLDAILAKEKLKALKLANEILPDSSETLYIIFLLNRQLRQLLQIKELSGKLGIGEIGRQVGLFNRMVLEKMLLRSKHFSKRSLVLAISRLAMWDDRIKRSSVDTRVFAELMIHDLTN